MLERFTMYEKGGKYYADWRDRKGQRKRKSFNSKRAALTYEDEQKGLCLLYTSDQLFEKNPQGEIAELAPESGTTFFYPNGSSFTRLIFERDAQGRVAAALFRDDRHEERWEKRNPASSR